MQRSQAQLKLTYPMVQTIAAVLRMLDDLENWIEEIPLRTGPQRFGNAAFRDWGARLVEVRT